MNSGGQGLTKWYKGSGCGYKKATYEKLEVVEYLPLHVVHVNNLWYCSVVLQEVATGKKQAMVQRISLHYFLQLHVNLQLPQNKNL